MDSPLISPAKARQAAIQTKDWAYVNSWLNRQYAPKSVPKFERNEDTLRVLLTLAAANDAADDEAALQQRAREEAIQAYKTREEFDRKDPHELQKNQLLDEVEMSLDDRGRRDLEDLADSAAALGNTLNPNIGDLGQSIVELTVEEFEAQEQFAKVETLHRYLRQELVRLQMELQELKSDVAYETPADIQKLTSDWARGTKTLAIKVAEYQDRIASLERVQPQGPTIEELMAEEESVIKLRETVKSLQGRVRAFQNLPKDVSGARAKYKELQSEFNQLTQKRDAMLDSLVERR
jgi:HAUS augmin-like complex subunit 1